MIGIRNFTEPIDVREEQMCDSIRIIDEYETDSKKSLAIIRKDAAYEKNGTATKFLRDVLWEAPEKGQAPKIIKNWRSKIAPSN